MSYERPLLSTLRTELSRPTPVIHVLIGPRQVGKTTIASQIEKSIGIPTVYATADSPVPLDSAWIETQWRRAVADCGPSGGPILLILDEVQKVRGWSETLKFLWDSRPAAPEIRVLILGSSSLLMQEGLTESLAGRFFLHRCNHWGYPECRTAFGWNLEQWIYFGGYPGAASFTENESSWKRYITDSLIETVLARDVLQMSKIAKPVLLRHLFVLAATLPAQFISYTKMLGQLHDAGNTTTLAHYLKLLESAFLSERPGTFLAGETAKARKQPEAGPLEQRPGQRPFDADLHRRPRRRDLVGAAGGKCRRRASMQQPPFGGIRAHLLAGGGSRGRFRGRQGTGRLGHRDQKRPERQGFRPDAVPRPLSPGTGAPRGGTGDSPRNVFQ